MELILIRGARCLLTLRGLAVPRLGASLNDLGVISDGAVLVRDGVVLEVGPSRRLENLAEARDAVEINAAGRLVMPGFVDSHTHLAFPPAGVSAPDDEAAARGLHAATGQRLEFHARAFIDAMARHGTTTVEVKTGCGPSETGEFKLLRVLAALHKDPLDVIATYLFHLPHKIGGGCSVDVAQWAATELLPKIRRRRGADFADVAWHPNPDLVPCFEIYLKAARALGFACKIHADGADPTSAIDLAVRYGAAGVDHLEYATELHARQLGAAGIFATLLPGVSFNTDGQAPPARTLIDAGVAVALGTNFNPHHTPILSMQTIIALASWRCRMTLEEAISAATINGAHALGCADRTGSLEPGKSADLLILNVADYRDLATNIGTNLVHRTMKRGKFIYKEGAVTARPPRVAIP